MLFEASFDFKTNFEMSQGMAGPVGWVNFLDHPATQSYYIKVHLCSNFEMAEHICFSINRKTVFIKSA